MYYSPITPFSIEIEECMQCDVCAKCVKFLHFFGMWIRVYRITQVIEHSPFHAMSWLFMFQFPADMHSFWNFVLGRVMQMNSNEAWESWVLIHFRFGTVCKVFSTHPLFIAVLRVPTDTHGESDNGIKKQCKQSVSQSVVVVNSCFLKSSQSVQRTDLPLLSLLY
jgi:hypothetical protein